MTATINAADVKCPKCGGPVWDERPDKKNPRGPDFRCKDKTCLDEKGYKTSIWEKDLVKAGLAPRATAPAPVAKQGYSIPPYVPAIDGEHPALPHERLDKMFAVYDLCLAHAHAKAVERFGKDVTDEAVAAMSATLFIQAVRG